jgi:hypothetical protein
MAAGDLTTLANVKQWLSLTGLAISGISGANPAVVTLATQPQIPLVSGAQYAIDGVLGMSQANGTWTITVLTPTTFSIPLDATALPAYAGGGYVGISDPLLQRLITAVSTFIQSWLNRTIAAADYTETRNGQGAPAMLTFNYPILAVSAVSVDGVNVPPRPALGPGTYAQPGGFVFDQRQIMLSGGCWRFTRGFQNVTFAYRAGFESTPPDLEQACIDLIGDWFKYASRIGVTSMAIEQQTVTYVNAAITARAQGVLNQYRRVAPLGP